MHALSNLQNHADNSACYNGTHALNKKLLCAGLLRIMGTPLHCEVIGKTIFVS